MGANTSTRDEYRYDRVSRLREANLKSFSPIKNQKYDFDAYGNLVRVTTGMTVENYRVCTNGPTQPHEYCQNQSPTNRLLDGAYDEAGNLIQWGNVKYEFDLLNTLHYTTSGGGAGWEFIYNADDERILAFQPGGTQTIWTLRDLQGQVLRRVATDVGIQYTTTIQTDYIRRGTLLLGAITTSEGGAPEELGESTSFGTGTTRHFALDHLGSVRLISSATGTTIGKHTYYPFGREATPSLDTEPMKFANHERDGFETGFDLTDDLDYMHSRYHSPLMARFLSVDSVLGRTTQPQTWNRYSYVHGNPLGYIDPDGRDALAVTFVGYKVPTPFGPQPLGHSGITISKAGRTRYYEFGRYNPTQVRYRGPLPNLTLGSNGVPTQASLKHYLHALTVEAGKGNPIEAAYFVNDKADAMLKFADERLADASKQGTYSLAANNCATFCEDVLRAGGEKLDTSLVNTPGNVIQELQDVADFSLHYDPKKGELKVTCSEGKACPEK